MREAGKTVAAPRRPRRERKKNSLYPLKNQIDLQLMVIPSIILLFIFAYIPLYGLIMAFQDYQLGDFPGISKFAGLKHFRALVKDPNFLRVLRNTIVISLLKLLINFPLPIIFAVLVTEVRWKPLRRSVQTISYLPHFISWVVAARLMFEMFSPDGGAVNQLLMSLGILDRPISFFNRTEYYWPIAVITDLWKELGWNSIIYFAAIAAIDVDIYEAAEIDGASRFQMITRITIPAIKPTIILLLIFTVGGILNANFDQSMMLTNQMSNAMLREHADILDTYVYRVGLSNGRYSFATAVSLLKSVVNFGLLLGANLMARSLGESSLF